MQFLGEILAVIVAILWTISSLSSEYASKRYGSLLLNIIRMVIAILFIAGTLWIATGSPLPSYTTSDVWMWLALSAFVGYIIGDYYFLQAFILIGARWGELFMTLAPPAAALTGWLLLGEQMSWIALLGMFITMCGIGMSVLSKKEDSNRISVKLPLRGIVYGAIAGIGQGVGLVFSKQGMLLYNASIQSSIINQQSSIINLLMPFAATMIRCMVALVGFVILYAIARQLGKDNHPMRLILEDKKALRLATLSTIAGPCIGVAVSLAAAMYASTGITQTIMALVPVLILWPSHLLFQTKITPLEVIGAIISVAGVALFFV